MIRSLLSASILCALIGSGAALAQTPAPAQSSQTDKQTISKLCSDQANAKGLHGKARKKFRSECKKNGGKPT
jgi:hypothetical protein